MIESLLTIASPSAAGQPDGAPSVASIITQVFLADHTIFLLSQGPLLAKRWDTLQCPLYSLTRLPISAPICVQSCRPSQCDGSTQCWNIGGAVVVMLRAERIPRLRSRKIRRTAPASPV